MKKSVKSISGVLLLVMVLLVSVCAAEAATKARAKNVRDYFLMLPDEVVFDHGTDERKAILAGDKVQSLLHLAINDVQNGYIRLEGSFNGVWEMCFWNTNKSNIKLIGVNYQVNGEVSRTQYLKFYEYNTKDESFTEVDRPFNTTVEAKDLLNMRMLNATQKEAAQGELEYLYKLPQKGKNITVYLEPDNSEFPKNALRKYTLRWNGESFK